MTNRRCTRRSSPRFQCRTADRQCRLCLLYTSGTPISTKDRSTREVFGDYIDIYDMTQAVEDGATRPVYYESRVIHLKPVSYTHLDVYKRQVPENARWSAIAAAAHTPEIGTVIDDAMRSSEKENKRLKDILPKNFARPELDKRRLGEVVDLFTNIQMIEHGSIVDSTDDLILLQRRMQFTAVQHIAGFQIFHATTRNGQVHVFINP